MRKLALLATAVPLLLAPPVVAADSKADEQESICRVPDAHSRYEVDRFTVRVSLPVSGCAGREDRYFDLSIRVVRMDNHGGRDVTQRTTVCGPVGPGDQGDPHGVAPRSSCDLTLTVDHPDVEAAQYDVDITYPGAAAERTMNAVLFCRSDGDRGACEEVAPSAERDVAR